jgi:hypothetical protein
MVALLRYIYDLPYDVSSELPWVRLEPLAMIYVVADKTQVDGLKQAVSKRMKSYLEDHAFDEGDFINALKTIITGTTPHDIYVWKMMVNACVVNLRYLRGIAEFTSLLREHADLGADIIGHSNLECGLPGDWLCGKHCEEGCRIWCPRCGTFYSRMSACDNHEMEVWSCESCGIEDAPACAMCGKTVAWRRRGLP